MWKKVYFNDIFSLSKTFVELCGLLSKNAIDKSGFFNFMISGGKTPETFFSMLAGAEDFDWKRIRIFWTDERFVPSSDKLSNYGAAKELFIGKIPIPPQNVIRIDTDYSSSALAANAHAETVRKIFGDGIPRFDLVLAGMGPDGHFASIFPDSPALREKEKILFDVPAPTTCEPKVTRITFSIPVFNSARKLIFMIHGREKIALFEKSLSLDCDPDFPVSFLGKTKDAEYFCS
jgi:6-phosphogluconolactonase